MSKHYMSKKKTVESPYQHLYARMNQLSNVRNPHQGNAKRVLFLCSAGLLRSATAAHVFSAEPYHWNTRTAGVAIEYALNPVNQALLEWADIVYVMEYEHIRDLERIFGDRLDFYKSKIYVLHVPDYFEYMSPPLVKLLRETIETNVTPAYPSTVDTNDVDLDNALD